MVNARLASERVKRKMVRPFAGSSLLEIALNKLKKCKFIGSENLYLGAYDEEIKEVGRKCGVQVYNRTYESTLEPVSMEVLYKWLWDIESKYVLEINPCNPLLEADTIEKALTLFFEKGYRSLFSVVERKNFYFDKDSRLVNNFLGEKTYLHTLETKLIEPLYEAAHCIYIWNADRVRREWKRFNFSKDDPFLFSIPPEEAFDIDYPWQFELAENIYKIRKGVKE